MDKYRKLIAAIIGVVAMILGPTVLAIGDGDTIVGIGQETLVQAIIGLATAFGVFQLRNET